MASIDVSGAVSAPLARTELRSERLRELSRARAWIVTDGKAGDENLQEHLDGVKKTLAETRRATGIEFLCFRQTKDRSKEKAAAPTGSRPKERERDSPNDMSAPMRKQSVR